MQNSFIKYLLFISLSIQVYALSEYAASFETVNSAKCSTKVPSNWQITQYARPYLNTKIDEAYSLLVKTYVYNGLKDKADFKTKIAAANKCHTKSCKLKELFESDELIEKSIFLLFKYGLNTSPYANKDAALLDLEQMDAIIKGVNLLPTHLPKLWVSKRLVRHIKKDIGYGHRGMIFANASIELYAPWDRELDEDGKAYSLFHELGHNLAYFYNLNYSSFWWDMSGWIDHPMGWRYNRDEMVSKYGQTNPSEDAAESIAAYRLNPTHLKKVSPKKYAFIRDYIFLGQEYLNGSSCSNTPVKSYLEKLISSAHKTCKSNDCLITNIKTKIKDDNRYPLFLKAKDDFFKTFLTR
ncbi:hypothetical protein ABMA77_09820 [Halobacteriovorax sp. RZ-1]|uniref:hypothetical protein n=1 Tax=unclassified Halobacteriovorax TaxID=2639665 RepID=UPI0037209C8D